MDEGILAEINEIPVLLRILIREQQETRRAVVAEIERIRTAVVNEVITAIEQTGLLNQEQIDAVTAELTNYRARAAALAEEIEGPGLIGQPADDDEGGVTTTSTTVE